MVTKTRNAPTNSLHARFHFLNTDNPDFHRFRKISENLGYLRSSVYQLKRKNQPCPKPANYAAPNGSRAIASVALSPAVGRRTRATRSTCIKIGRSLASATPGRI